MKTNLQDVREFTEKFGLSMPDKPTQPDLEMINFRLQFLKEELEELEEALTHPDPVERLADVADALVDLVYVAMGTALVFGLPWQAVWDEVQRTNMAKRRVERAEDTRRGTAYDVVKPVGWEPPRVSEIIHRALEGTLACGASANTRGDIGADLLCARPFTHPPDYHECFGFAWPATDHDYPPTEEP